MTGPHPREYRQLHISVIRIFPSFPRRRESRIRTNSVVFGPKFIRIPTLAGMTADLTALTLAFTLWERGYFRHCLEH